MMQSLLSSRVGQSLCGLQSVRLGWHVGGVHVLVVVVVVVDVKRSQAYALTCNSQLEVRQYPVAVSNTTHVRPAIGWLVSQLE